VGKTQAMHQVYELILKAAAVDANVVVYGETGTGKELVARAIHDLSRRRCKKFIAVNCGAIPETIIESEFFGYKKGAFTGAARDKTGFLDTADQGTLFLDELEEMSLKLQVKMLRAIDGHGFIPLGGNQVKLPDLRIIAATNKLPRDLVQKGTMREDFYFRINIIPVYVPPLRERKADIPRLVTHFLRRLSPSSITALPDAVMRKFMDYDWPGNVRELQNALHRYVSLEHVDFMAAPGNSKTAGTPQSVLDARPLRQAVQHFEKEYIISLLDQHRWCRTKVAKVLEIDRRTLHRKLKEYGITDSI
jgi:transcriptional regulator with PAS, ATPase and Fis domain